MGREGVNKPFLGAAACRPSGFLCCLLRSLCRLAHESSQTIRGIMLEALDNYISCRHFFSNLFKDAFVCSAGHSGIIRKLRDITLTILRCPHSDKCFSSSFKKTNNVTLNIFLLRTSKPSQPLPTTVIQR